MPQRHFVQHKSHMECAGLGLGSVWSDVGIYLSELRHYLTVYRWCNLRISDNPNQMSYNIMCKEDEEVAECVIGRWISASWTKYNDNLITSRILFLTTFLYDISYALPVTHTSQSKKHCAWGRSNICGTEITFGLCVERLVLVNILS
jgi:hypothetical protein